MRKRALGRVDPPAQIAHELRELRNILARAFFGIGDVVTDIVDPSLKPRQRVLGREIRLRLFHLAKTLLQLAECRFKARELIPMCVVRFRRLQLTKPLLQLAQRRLELSDRVLARPLRVAGLDLVHALLHAAHGVLERLECARLIARRLRQRVGSTRERDVGELLHALRRVDAVLHRGDGLIDGGDRRLRAPLGILEPVGEIAQAMGHDSELAAAHLTVQHLRRSAERLARHRALLLRRIVMRLLIALLLRHGLRHVLLKRLCI